MKTKKSDLSMYDKPFNIDDFIFATPLSVRKIKLSRPGFTSIIARLMSDGSWQGLSHTDHYGSEHWITYNAGFVENFINNLPDSDTLEELL